MARPIVQLFGFFIMLNRVRFTQYTVNKISYSNKASVLNPVFSKTVILTETTVSLSLIFKSVRPKQDYTQVKYCNFIFFFVHFMTANTKLKLDFLLTNKAMSEREKFSLHPNWDTQFNDNEKKLSKF